jgi:hypothetical protein
VTDQITTEGSRTINLKFGLVRGRDQLIPETLVRYTCQLAGETVHLRPSLSKLNVWVGDSGNIDRNKGCGISRFDDANSLLVRGGRRCTVSVAVLRGSTL